MTLRAGFDVGGTNARVQLFDGTTSRGEARARIRDATGPDEVTRRMAALLKTICDEAGISPGDLSSIGVGLAAQFSADRRIVKNSPNLGWRDLPFADLLTDALPRDCPPISLVNDLTAQIWGEALAGAVQGFDDVLAVYVGTGIGGAILAGGRIVDGAGHNTGEIGHVKVVVDGRPCGCGEAGCVEAYAGGVHLEARLADLAAAHPDDGQLSSLVSDDRVDLGRADELAGDHPAVKALWQEATDHLGLVVANAITLLNPAALLLGGGVLDNCLTFRQMTIDRALPLVLQVARDDLQICRAALGDLAGMLGAADLAARGW